MVDRLTEKYEGEVEVRKLNVDDDDEAASLASSYRVQYVPTFVFVHTDGTVAAVLVGAVSEDELTEAIESLR